MRDIPIVTGPVDYGEESGETGDTPKAPENSPQRINARAHGVPINLLFKYYKLRLDQFNKKIVCPFKSHKNGHESRASFTYYPETNSFNCYGCHTGGGPVQFMMHMENIQKNAAAIKILGLFGKHVDEDLIFNGHDSVERVEIMTQFSNAVLEFRQNHDSEHAFQYIEYLCWVYDRTNLKHADDEAFTNDSLRRLNDQLIECIEVYQPDLRFYFEDKYLQVTCL